jgi:hypothetical protein
MLPYQIPGEDNDSIMPTFSSTLNIQVFIRLSGTDWQEFDLGPGVFHIPEEAEVGVRLHNSDNRTLVVLVTELTACPALTMLNLSENRKINNDGLSLMSSLPSLTQLNLSSCDLTNDGLVHLISLRKLAHLNLSYCNRLTADCLKHLKKLPALVFLDMQGCLRIKSADMVRFQRKGLVIHK